MSFSKAGVLSLNIIFCLQISRLFHTHCRSPRTEVVILHLHYTFPSPLLQHPISPYISIVLSHLLNTFSARRGTVHLSYLGSNSLAVYLCPLTILTIFKAHVSPQNYSLNPNHVEFLVFFLQEHSLY